MLEPSIHDCIRVPHVSCNLSNSLWQPANVYTFLTMFDSAIYPQVSVASSPGSGDVGYQLQNHGITARATILLVPWKSPRRYQTYAYRQTPVPFESRLTSPKQSRWCLAKYEGLEWVFEYQSAYYIEAGNRGQLRFPAGPTWQSLRRFRSLLWGGLDPFMESVVACIVWLHSNLETSAILLW
jgi:hypothetical protein